MALSIVRYFAYGSNMLSARLRERLGVVQVQAVGWLAGRELRFHKVSEDGSAKCDIHETGSPDHYVHGVVFEIDLAQKRILDRFEGLGQGYEEEHLRISLRDGGAVEAVAYCATRLDDGLRPYDWYRALVLAGAREHGLPAKYIEEVARVSSMVDPDRERARRHQRLVS